MNEGPIYLSVDLDFWNQGSHRFKHLDRFMRQIVSHIDPREIGIFDSHEEILDHVNGSGCLEVVNVDWHSDLVNINDPVVATWESWQSLNCGSWVNFVEFQNRGKFTWIHPYKIKASGSGHGGYCHRPYKETHNPFVRQELTDWLIVEDVASRVPEEVIDWDRVTHVGIVFSYDWVEYSLEKYIYSIAEKYLGKRAKVNEKARLG